MSLKEILEKMIEKGEPVLLNDGQRDWEAGVLLEPLRTQVKDTGTSPARIVYCRDQRFWLSRSGAL